MVDQKPTSKTPALNLLLLKAWKERWSIQNWGINIKSLLPRGVSGDTYNLADVMLQQICVGSGANPLILGYLKHSLCSHQVSYAAVYKRISRYDNYDKYHCLISLLDFVQTTIDGVTCRNKTEESILPNALLSLVVWLIQIFEYIMNAYIVDRNLTSIQKEVLQKAKKVTDTIESNQFVLAAIYVAKFEDPELYSRLTIKYCDINSSVLKSDYPMELTLSDSMRKIAFVDVRDLSMKEYNCDKDEPISHCLQPLIAFEILLRPSADVKQYAQRLKMVQTLKDYPNSRFYMELLKACLIVLYTVNDTTRDSLFTAFIFMKIPQILKVLDLMSREDEFEYSADVVEAFVLLCKETEILNYNDTQLHENTLECLMKEMQRQGLVTEKHIQHVISKREAVSLVCQKLTEPKKGNTVLSMVQKTESPLNGILRTFNSDYTKVQDAIHSMLFQMLKGSSQELIINVAIVEGKFKTFMSLLIKCNEYTRQNPNENDKPSLLRAELFDVTFLILVYAIQSYGSEAVLDGRDDTFFEKWVRDCMVERNKPKSPMALVRQCDTSKVDELILHFRNPETTKCSLKWEDICRNIPGVLYHTLQAWENDTITATDVKTILDGLTKKLAVFSVCAGSWLCSYMQTIRQEELQKAMNMVQLIGQTNSDDENVRRRLGLTHQIVRKMQFDFHPAGSPKIRALMHTQNLVSRTPLQEQFDEIWKNIHDIGFLSVESAQLMESLLQACGHTWLVQKLINQILQCKFIHEMRRTADIAFAVMHLDIEKCTLALLNEILPPMLLNRRSTKLVEPYSVIIARFCVYAILSNVQLEVKTAGRKRKRSEDEDEKGPSPKLLKLNADMAIESGSGGEFPNSRSATLSPALTKSLQNLFQIFQFYLNTDSLDPKVYFIFQFISILIQRGKDKCKPILKTFPTSLIQSVLKIIPTEDLSAGFVLQSYDLETTVGRQTCVWDLCLLRNIQLKNSGIQF